MHVALGYQYPSHMLQLMLVAAFCHLRLTLKETTPLPLLSPHPSSPPLLSPPKKQKETNTRTIKAKKQSSCWHFGGGWGGGVWGSTHYGGLIVKYCVFFFPSIFFNQLHLNLNLQRDQVSISFFTS